MPLSRINQNSPTIGLKNTLSGLSSGGTGLKRISSTNKNSIDLTSADGLLKYAQQKGLLDTVQEIDQPDKLSLLQRLSYGLGSLNPAEAIAREVEGSENFFTAYPKTVVSGILSALTGNDYGEQTKRRFFADLLEDLGMENKYARFGLGLVGDIFLDPSTYVGGTIMRGVGKSLKFTGKTAMKGITKVSPGGATKLVEAGQVLKGAGGQLFVFGYGTSEAKTSGEAVGLAQEFLEFEGRKMNIEKALAVSNAKRYGTDLLTDSQWEQFLDQLFKGKTAEFNYFDDVTDEMIGAFNKKFPGAKFPLKNIEAVEKSLTETLGREVTKIEVRAAIRQQTINKLSGLSTSIPKKIGKLQALREKLAQPFIENDLMGLKATVVDLKEELASLIPKEIIKGVKPKPFMASLDEIDNVLMDALSIKEKEYTKIILDLEAKINGIESGIITPAIKKVMQQSAKENRYTVEEILQQTMRRLNPELKIKDKLVEVNKTITTLTNDMFSKQRILENVLSGKQIAKERIAKAFATGDFKALPDELVDALRPAIKAFVPEGKLTPAMIIETRGGWRQNMKAKFDLALLNKDADKIIELLPEAPIKYQQEFAKELKAILGESFEPGRVAKFFPDETVEKALIDRLRRNKNLAEAAGIDDPFVIYAPSISRDITERQRLTNFFSGTRSVKVGSKDYTKEFRNLLKESELLKDRSLFLRVEDQVATNALTEEFLKNTIKDYGVGLETFKTEQEALIKGYKLLKNKGIFGKELGYVKEADWKFLNSQINSNYKAIDAIAKATGFDQVTSLFKRWVTGPFAPFHIRNWTSGEIQNYELIGSVAQAPKVQATGIRLGNKISRGAFSSIVDPFDGALTIGKKIETFGNETIELAGKTWKLDDIGTAIERRFGGSSRYNVDYNSLTSDADKLISSKLFSKETMKAWGKKFVKGKEGKTAGEKVIKEIQGITGGLVGEDNPIFRGARVVGASIEMMQKSKLVVGAMERGHTLEEALNIAAKGGFDYRALTQFESKILRRIIPFYSFNRKNIELQLHVLKTNPQRINQIIRSIENIQNLWESNLTPEEKENLPAYLKEYLSVPIGKTKAGLNQFVRGFGTPIEAFTELIKFKAEGKSTMERTFLGIISRVNPYLKVPIELGIGKDSFRQRDLKEVYTATEYQIAPQFIKDALKLKEIKRQDLKTGRIKTVYVADPERLLVARSLFTSRGFTYFNNIFNNDLKGFFSILDAVSGIQSIEIDLERQAGFNERRKKEEISNILRRYGILSEFNKLFIPKK